MKTQRFLAVLTVIFMLTAVMAYAASPNARIKTLKNSITPDGYVSNGGLDFRVIFNQPVKGLNESGIVVDNTDNIRDYIWDVYPLNSSEEGFSRKWHVSLDFVGGVGISHVRVAANAAQNGEGEGNSVSEAKRYKVDTKIPRVSYISTPNSTNGSFPALIGISEQVYLMDRDAIKVAGASWTFSRSTEGLIGQLRLQITPDDGVTEVKISVNQYCFIDKGGNYNPRSTEKVVNIQ